MKTQTERIKSLLNKGSSITSKEALKYYKCSWLSAMVFDFKKSGMRIIKTPLKGKNKTVKYLIKK